MVRVRTTEACLVLGAALVILAMGAWITFGPEVRIAFLMSDDAYYYLSIARNLADGAGSTADGINTTNGYHPLWCWLLAPLFRLTEDPGTIVRLAGMLWFLAAGTSIVALWWALRHRAGSMQAILAAALFGLHPFVGLATSRANGLETPLFAVLLAVSIGYFAGAREDRPVVLGILLGFVALARFDGLLLGPMAAAFLWTGLSRREGYATAFRRAAVVLLAMGATVAPYLVWNFLRFHHPMPISGRVIQHYGQTTAADLSITEFLMTRAYHLFESVPLLIAGHTVTGTGATGAIENGGWAAGTIVLLGASGLIAWAWRIRCMRAHWSEDPFCLLASFTAVHYLVNAGWFWTGGERIFRLYYFMPEVMLMAAATGTVLGYLIGNRFRCRNVRAVACGCFLACAGGYFVAGVLSNLAREELIHADHRPVSQRQIFGWIPDHLPEDAVLASHSSGILGFFGGRPVVNLDGLVNGEELFRAIREDRVHEYVARSPVRYLVGHDDAFERLHSPDGDPAYDLGSVTARIGRIDGVEVREMEGTPAGWRVFEIVRTSVASR
jgi:hypothetical protein